MISSALMDTLYRKVHNGEYKEHATTFKKMDGPQLLALEKEDFKELVESVADGIVLYHALAKAAKQGSTNHQEQDREEESKKDPDDEEDDKPPPYAGPWKAEDIEEAHADVLDIMEDPLDRVPPASTEQSEKEFEEIKRKSQEARELALLKSRRPRHSSISWNLDGGWTGLISKILWPFFTDEKSKSGAQWNSEEPEQGHSTGIY